MKQRDRPACVTIEHPYPPCKTISVALTPELEQLIQQKVATGSYTSANEVIRVALLLLEEQEERDRRKLETLKKEIAIGIEQLRNGNYSEYDESSLPDLISEIQTEGRKKLTSGQTQNQG